MIFSANISNKLTEIITRELDYNEDKKEIIAYAIETTLQSVSGALLIIFLGYSFNVLIPVAIATVFGGSLRRLSGGAHFNTPLKCLVFGAIIYCSIGVSAQKLIDYGLINQLVLMFMLLISFLLVSFFAPVDSEPKPIHSRSLKFKLKISSMIFVIVTFLIISFSNSPLVNVSAVLGVFYQCTTLLPIFNKKGGECSL